MDHVPGIYSGVPMRDYHAAPAVNAGLLLTIIERCPAAAAFSSWMNPDYRPEPATDVMNIGSIAHAILLEGGCDRVEVIDPFDHPAKTSGAIPEGWTNQ